MHNKNHESANLISPIHSKHTLYILCLVKLHTHMNRLPNKLIYQSYEVYTSLALLQHGIKEGRGPFHMTPTRGPGQRNDRQTALPQRNKARSCQQIPQPSQDSHPLVNLLSKQPKFLGFRNQPLNPPYLMHKTRLGNDRQYQK